MSLAPPPRAGHTRADDDGLPDGGNGPPGGGDDDWESFRRDGFCVPASHERIRAARHRLAPKNVGSDWRRNNIVHEQLEKKRETLKAH